MEVLVIEREGETFKLQLYDIEVMTNVANYNFPVTRPNGIIFEVKDDESRSQVQAQKGDVVTIGFDQQQRGSVVPARPVILRVRPDVLWNDHQNHEHNRDFSLLPCPNPYTHPNPYPDSDPDRYKLGGDGIRQPSHKFAPLNGIFFAHLFPSVCFLISFYVCRVLSKDDWSANASRILDFRKRKKHEKSI